MPTAKNSQNLMIVSLLGAIAITAITVSVIVYSKPATHTKEYDISDLAAYDPELDWAMAAKTYAESLWNRGKDFNDFEYSMKDGGIVVVTAKPTDHEKFAKGLKHFQDELAEEGEIWGHEKL